MMIDLQKAYKNNSAKCVQTRKLDVFPKILIPTKTNCINQLKFYYLITHVVLSTSLNTSII